MFRNDSESRALERTIASLEKRLDDEIDSLALDGGDSDIEQIVKELSQRHALQCPKMLKDEACINEPIDCQVDVRNDRSRNVTDRTKPCMVDGKRIVVSIPVSGDISLLIRKPTSPNGLSGTLTLGRDSIEVAYTKPFPINNAMLDLDIKNDLKAIDSNMGFCTTEIDQFNRELPSILRTKIGRKLQSIEARKHSFEGLSLPIQPRMDAKEPSSTSPKSDTIQPAQIKIAEKRSKVAMSSSTSKKYDFDVFICHASEDKADLVEQLAKELAARGVKVWYDAFALKLGDSLRRKIDEGLSKSKFGLVILSPAFFKKQWPQRELDGLTEKEMRAGEKVILPIWHNVSHDDVLEFSPPLADKLAGQTKDFSKLVDDIVDAVRAAS
jgi:hypothetical protein